MNNNILLRRRLRLPLTLVAGLGLSFWLIGSALSSPQTEDGLPHLLATSRDRLSLELVLPAFHIEERSLNGLACQTITISGFGESSPPGQPSLPGRGTMIGVPPASDLTFQIVEAEPVPVPGRFNLCPTGQPILETSLDGQIDYQGVNYVQDPASYSQDTFLPSSPFIVDSNAFIRSQQVAVARFQPFQYNPVSGELRYYPRIRVQINLSPVSTEAVPAPMGRVDEGAFEPILHQSLVNYEQSRDWRLLPAIGSESLAVETAPAPGWYKISVNQDGLYQVTYADLVTAGFPVTEIDPRNISFSYNAGAMRIQIVGEEDGIFDPEDYILFYGEKQDSKYTETSVYWMTWGDTPGLRFYTQDGTPSGADVPQDFATTLSLEDDLIYQSARPSGADLDHWYWKGISATTVTASVDFTFDLQYISTDPVNAVIHGLLRSYSATPEHHTRIYLNGNLIDDANWPVNSEYAFDLLVPQSDLLEGINTIRVEAVLGEGTTQQVLFVNRLAVDYDDLFVAENDQLIFSYDASGTWEFHLDGFTTNQLNVLDITFPYAAHIYSGYEVVDQGGSFLVKLYPQVPGVRRFLVTANANWLQPISIQADITEGLNSIWNEADYIIIAPADFIPALQPLAEHRERRGLRVKIVDLQDVYDVYSGGMVNPNAIHDFIAYTYSNWTLPAPAYVLLVGDGHYDFLNNRGLGEPIYMPPFLGEFDPWIGETASDNRYVTVSGEDILPDLFIGRLPVRSASETTDMVSKIIQYETQPLEGDWNNQLLFVADNADDGGDFAAISDSIIASTVPVEYGVERIYYFITHTTTDSTRLAIQSAINDGRLIVSYVGHASVNWWAYEKLLNTADVPLLNNPTRLPFFIPMTCLEGYFINPSATPLTSGSLGEVIVRASGRGAIASWSPTGLGIAAGHDMLENSLLNSLLVENLTRFGPATTQAKYYLYANSLAYHDLIDTYLLFGDPAVRLRTLNTWFGNIYLPLITK